jgi:cyclic pyranopterin phosphate synthase
MLAATTAAVAQNALNKGDVLATARVAGIQAAKQAASLLPMSHLVLVGNVHVNFNIADTHIDIEASVDTVDRTGVEMEALMAVTVAALTIYDMCKSNDRTMTIEEVAIWEKSGGRSGNWRREEALAAVDEPTDEE